MMDVFGDIRLQDFETDEIEFMSIHFKDGYSRRCTINEVLEWNKDASLYSALLFIAINFSYRSAPMLVFNE